jgi:BON domain
MVRMTVFALAACAGLALGCSRERPDASVNAAVVAQLDKEPSLQAAIVHARTEEGHVYLSGRVTSPEQRRRAEDIADDIRGVKGVTNDIEVDVSAPPAAPPVPPQESPTAPPPGPMGNEPPITTPMPDQPEDGK